MSQDTGCFITSSYWATSINGSSIDSSIWKYWTGLSSIFPASWWSRWGILVPGNTGNTAEVFRLAWEYLEYRGITTGTQYRCEVMESVEYLTLWKFIHEKIFFSHLLLCHHGLICNLNDRGHTDCMVHWLLNTSVLWWLIMAHLYSFLNLNCVNYCIISVL